MTESYGVDTTEELAGPLLRQIGTHLRRAREERGEALRDVAEVLRIRRPYLEHLEEGELAEIPGRTYALGFLRSYADHLGFDGAAIVDEVKRAKADLPSSPALHVREPLPESQRPPLFLVGASVVLAAALYLGWNMIGQRDVPDMLADLGIDAPPNQASAEARTDGDGPAAAETGENTFPEEPDSGAITGRGDGNDDQALLPLPPIPEPPRSEAPGLTALAVDAGEQPAAAAVENDGTVDQAPAAEQATAPLEPAAEQDEQGQVPANAPPSRETLLAAVAAVIGGETPQAFGENEASSRVVVVASQPSWVQIRSADRAFVWTRTMEPGDAFFVPDREDLALWTGNAGGLTLIVDGEPLAEVGDDGAVRRDIPLAADALRAQYATN